MEVGNAMLGRPGVMELILALADSGNAIHTVSHTYYKIIWYASHTFCML